jgi:anti-sigma regulatory factor (Ser/Thr protein kinase)
MTVSRRFEASEDSVGAARRFVTGIISDTPTDVQDSVAVMVSELATNALLHASGGFEVAVDRSELTVSVSVSDRGDGAPVLQSPKFSEPHGRGLRIVTALSDQWGVSATSDGKAVWFHINLQNSATTASSGAAVGSAATASEGTPGSTSAAPLASPSPKARTRQTGSARSHHRAPRTRSSPVDRLTVRGRSMRSPGHAERRVIVQLVGISSLSRARTLRSISPTMGRT